MEYRGSFGLITFEKKVLMMLRDDNPEIQQPNTWCFIGGRDEDGETYEQTFLREAEEEISLRPTVFKFLKIFELEDKRYGVFTAELTPEEAAKVALGDEGQKLEFIDAATLPTLTIGYTHNEFVKSHPELLKELLGE